MGFRRIINAKYSYCSSPNCISSNLKFFQLIRFLIFSKFLLLFHIGKAFGTQILKFNLSDCMCVFFYLILSTVAFTLGDGMNSSRWCKFLRLTNLSLSYWWAFFIKDGVFKSLKNKVFAFSTFLRIQKGILDPSWMNEYFRCR